MTVKMTTTLGGARVLLASAAEAPVSITPTSGLVPPP